MHTERPSKYNEYRQPLFPLANYGFFSQTEIYASVARCLNAEIQMQELLSGIVSSSQIEGLTMATSPLTANKRTFYNILQVSEDADLDAITASYQRLKSKYKDVVDSDSINESRFIEHAFETLSDSNLRKFYDTKLANIPSPSIMQYGHYDQPDDKWFTSTKLIAVMFGVLALAAYGLNTRHSEETGKIGVSKEVVVGNNEVSHAVAESTAVLSNGFVQNSNKAIDRSAEVAQRALDIQREEADTRRMLTEAAIKASQEANKQRIAAQNEAKDRQARCQNWQRLINQANQAGLYQDARALQARGCS